MRLNRQDHLLNDVIVALDGRLREARGNVSEAWTRLTPTELAFVKEEITNCALNRMYYLQNYHVIQNEQGQLMGMHPIFSYQALLDEAIVEEVRINGKCFIIVLKPRQSGISEYSTGTMCHCTFFTPRSYTLSVAQDPSTAAHMQRKVNIAWENLPWWMRPERLYHSKGEYLEFNRQDEGERLLDPGLGSVYVTTHAQRTTGIAIGRTVRYLHLCLSSLNHICDEEGYLKSIADAKVADRVRTPSGVATITAVSRKCAAAVYPGAELGWRVTPLCGRAFPIEGTGNHRVKVVETTPIWEVEHRRKRIGDSIRDQKITWRGMKELRNLTKLDRLVYPVRRIRDERNPSLHESIKTGDARPQKGGFISEWIPPKKFGREFGFAIGLYLAEGCVTDGRRCVTISLDADERDLADRFARAVGMKYGKPSPHKGSRTVSYHFHSASITEWFRKHIGAKDLKHIPSWAWGYGRQFLCGVMEGMILGDGHINPGFHVIRFTSTRPHLAVELRDVACALGFGWGAIYRKDAGVHYGRNCQTVYNLEFGRLSNDEMRTFFEWPIATKPKVRRGTSTHWMYSQDRTEVYVNIGLIERVPLGHVYDIEVDSVEHEFLLPCAWTHNSELSRWASSDLYGSDIEPSLNAADTIAIAESTALGDEGFFYNLWQEAESGDSDWKPFFLPAYRAKKFSLPLKPSQKPFVLTEQEADIRDRVKKEEKFLVTDEFFNWRRTRIKASIRRTGHPYSHYESYPITAQEAFQSSGILVLPRHKLDEQNARIGKPKWIGEILFQGTGAAPKLLLREIKPDEAIEKREYENRLWVWEEPEPNAAYYMGVDTSLGNGGNMSAAEVLRAGSGMNPDVQVAEWVGWIPPTDWAKVLYAMGSWYNRCEIAVEYQAEGMTTANYLMNDLQYPNLYRPRHRDRFGRQLLSYLHWQTTGKTKPLLASKIVESLLENSVKIQSSFLMSQFYKLTAYKFDRMGNALSFEAEIGDDDAALAFIICLFCLRETMMELRVPDELPAGEGRTATRSASIHDVGKGPVTYGIYDEFFRQRTQLRDLQSAQKMVKANPGWSIREIPISKANTFYSTIHHGSGIENELYRQGGDSWEITPAVVQAYRNAGDREANPLLQPSATGRRSAQPPPSGEDLIGLSGANEMDG